MQMESVEFFRARRAREYQGNGWQVLSAEVFTAIGVMHHLTAFQQNALFLSDHHLSLSTAQHQAYESRLQQEGREKLSLLEAITRGGNVPQKYDVLWHLHRADEGENETESTRAEAKMNAYLEAMNAVTGADLGAQVAWKNTGRRLRPRLVIAPKNVLRRTVVACE